MSTLKTTWKGLKQGQGNIRGSHLDVPIAIPEAFGGAGCGANPKDMLKASTASCLVMTLAIMLESRNIGADDINVSTDITGETPRNLHISHSVVVSLPAGTTAEQEDKARKLIPAADLACMIGNLLRAAGVQISVSGEVSLTNEGI